MLLHFLTPLFLFYLWYLLKLRKTVYLFNYLMKTCCTHGGLLPSLALISDVIPYLDLVLLFILLPLYVKYNRNANPSVGPGLETIVNFRWHAIGSTAIQLSQFAAPYVLLIYQLYVAMNWERARTVHVLFKSCEHIFDVFDDWPQRLRGMTMAWGTAPRLFAKLCSDEHVCRHFQKVFIATISRLPFCPHSHSLHSL